MSFLLLCTLSNFLLSLRFPLNFWQKSIEVNILNSHLNCDMALTYTLYTMTLSTQIMKYEGETHEMSNDLFMLGRKMKCQVWQWVIADHTHVLYVSCFSWQCSQRPQLPGLHPTVEQPKWVPVHPPCLEKGGLRPLHGPHLLPDGLLLCQPVSRRGNLTLCGWPLLQLVLTCSSRDYTEREKKSTLSQDVQDALMILTPEPVEVKTKS